MIQNIQTRDPAGRASESSLNTSAGGRSAAPSSPPPVSTPAAPPSTAATAAGNANAPAVNISAEGQAMQKLADGLRQQPVNEQKVAALRQAIATNTYRIDPQQVAKKMLQFEQT